MVKHKKFFSRTGWENSFFGGFERMLWELPSVSLPYGFNMTPPDKEVSYLAPHLKQKLLATFLERINKPENSGIKQRLIETATPVIEKKNTTYGGDSTLVRFNFDKNQVKNALSNVIATESELKSLFINYSNFLSNSQMYYEKTFWDSKTDKEMTDSVLESFSTDFNNIRQYSNYYSGLGLVGRNNSLEQIIHSTKFEVMTPTSEIQYSVDEKKAADKLTGLLDINFDKDEMVVSSLRTGKLDQKKIAESLTGNQLLYCRKDAEVRTRPFAVCILNDESGSMGGSSGVENSEFKDRLEVQHSLTKILYKSFSEILPDERIMIYGHTGNSNPVIHVYQDRYNPNFELTYDQQHKVSNSQNYDGPVIQKIYDTIRAQTDSDILFIVISDGQPAGNGYGNSSDILDLKRIIEKCRRDGFVTCGIGFQYGGVKNIYQYHVILNDLSTTVNAVSNLINNVVKQEFMS